MSKVKVYLRVARNHQGRNNHKVQANVNPSRAPLYDSHGEALATIAFAIVLDIDPLAFRAAETAIAELQVGAADVEVAAELGP